MTQGNSTEKQNTQTRVYPLDPAAMTQEEMAVTFAMTSRSPQPFDQIAQEVTAEQAAGFHERWVIGYGHSSVAEHAVIHMAVENISRLACDTLEDNRLASYTEKSSRYQVIGQGSFHVPEEIRADPHARRTFQNAAQELFRSYEQMIEGCLSYLRMTHPQDEGERNGPYRIRLRRMATDACRAILPAATLTNVGVTINARSLQHAASKLLSSNIIEERRLGQALLEQGREIVPTLLRHAGESDHLHAAMGQGRQLTIPMASGTLPPEQQATLLEHTPDPLERIAAAILYRQVPVPMAQIQQETKDMGRAGQIQTINSRMRHIGDHDAAIREFEMADFTFELQMDYGAYREFRRHRMQSCFPQPLTIDLGYLVPPLIERAGLAAAFHQAAREAQRAYRELTMVHPGAAQYLVTHAHHRRLIARMNLRECYHVFRLRTSQLAHQSIRTPMLQAMELAVQAAPDLFRWLRLQEYPDWWASSQE